MTQTTRSSIAGPIVLAVMILLAALLAVAMFTLGRATAPDSPIRVTPPAQTIDTTAEAAQKGVSKVEEKAQEAQTKIDVSGDDMSSI